MEKQVNMVAIAVIDLSNITLSIEECDANMDSEEIEEFLDKKGYHLSNCSWGEFDGNIIDNREN